MNRIIIIGNGFDKAHGLATGYKDFIDDYWDTFSWNIFRSLSRWGKEVYGGGCNLNPYQDEFVNFSVYSQCEIWLDPSLLDPENKRIKDFWTYNDVHLFVEQLNAETTDRPNVNLTFKNKFFEHISTRYYLTNWVDIENEYYEKLKELLTESDAETRHQRVKQLNQDFEAVKKLLEKYLVRIVEEINPSSIPSVRETFKTFIEPQDVTHKVRADFIESIGKKSRVFDEYADQEKDSPNEMQSFWHNQAQTKLDKRIQDDVFKTKYCRPENTLLLNFNYTNIAECLYASEKDEVIHIHGELDNPHNPIIFGYGDELDDDYRQIEKLQDNDFLENIKSIRYHETGNYRNLLSFLEADLYQVVVMGHSCGNSDRTLLNTLFEHPNCASVKVYYHQIDENTDNYSQIVRNISRNFNDKAAMRDKVVNKELCTPLVPIQKE